MVAILHPVRRDSPPIRIAAPCSIASRPLKALESIVTSGFSIRWISIGGPTRMTDNAKPVASEPAPGNDTGALLLATGGFAAAFGAAACCALPVLLGSVGLGSAWLAAVAWVAAPYRIALLAIAVVCLASGGGVLLWRRRRMAACAA